MDPSGSAQHGARKGFDTVGTCLDCGASGFVPALMGDVEVDLEDEPRDDRAARDSNLDATRDNWDIEKSTGLVPIRHMMILGTTLNPRESEWLKTSSFLRIRRQR